jgi:hypothetical protein
MVGKNERLSSEQVVLACGGKSFDWKISHHESSTSSTSLASGRRGPEGEIALTSRCMIPKSIPFLAAPNSRTKLRQELTRVERFEKKKRGRSRLKKRPDRRSRPQITNATRNAPWLNPHKSSLQSMLVLPV